MPLLENRFAPITFRAGFVKAPLTEVVKQYVRWQHMLARIVTSELMEGSLDAKLTTILPLDEEGERLLFCSTKSDWVAIFDNRPEGDVADGAAAVLSERLGTTGLATVDVPNTFKKSNPPDARGTWGAVALSAYGRQGKTGIWGITRSVVVRNDASGWEFDITGDPWAFEDSERYELHPVRDRFNSALLLEYLRHFGINADDASFYHGQAITTRSRFPLNLRSKTYDLAKVQLQAAND